MKNVIVTLVFLVLMVCGCRVFQPTTNLPIPSNPTEVIYNTIQKTDYLMSLFIVGSVVGVIIGLSGAKFGWILSAGNGAGIFLYLTIAKYGSWMALMGIISVVAGIAYIIIYNKRFKMQNIKGIQEAKDRVTNEVLGYLMNVCNRTDPDATPAEIIAKAKHEIPLMVKHGINDSLKRNQDLLVQKEVQRCKAVVKIRALKE